MVTTRAMSRRSQRGGSVSSSSSLSNETNQTPARVDLEAQLRVEAASFLPSPAPSFLPSYPGSAIFEDASYAPPIGPVSGPMSSETIPRPRSLGGDPRLKAAMAKLLARFDGPSTSSVGVFKARPPPLTTSAVMSILHKVDNDLRRREQEHRHLSEGSSSNIGARQELASTSNCGLCTQEARPQDTQVQSYSFPSFTVAPKVSRVVQEDSDYAQDDRDPETLPPVSVQETERYAR
jgi:hypothetical protein